MNTIQPGRTSSSAILVVEDHAAQLETLIELLEMENFQPIRCPSGREAVEACQQHDVHVAILDLKLPDMDGLEVLSQLKQQRPEMKIIINTAYASMESAMEAVNNGVFAYVQKEGNVEELLTHVHRAFHTHFAEYNGYLEQEVNKRTTALSAANKALQQEIAERKRVEEQLKAALKEKEVLLQEIHHRVKNNMQAISSMLHLLYEKISDEQALAVLRGGDDRIRAMVTVHEMIYETEDFTHIDFRQYVIQIVYGLLRSYDISNDKITPIIDVERVFLEVDKAITCGLLINELVSNILKYAFPGDSTGRLTVSLHSLDDTFELMISDTGIGLPENVDFRKSKSLGLHLVQCWVNQLLGEIVLDQTEGTQFRITFKGQ